MKSNHLLSCALIAGLVSGSASLAFADAAPSPNPSPSPVAKKRLPHKEIKNKNNCCKGGCGCMDEKTGGQKMAPPPNTN
jgi:hypothetical protein